MDDPEPVCPPPAWAARIIETCKAHVGCEVYPPSDDTFLLLEALAHDGALLRESRPMVCLELGCGSGAVSAGLLEILHSKANSAGDGTTPLMLSLDKNPAAAKCTNAVLQTVPAERSADVIQGSLTDCLRQGSLVDIVICNPPYVPTDEEEMQGCGISISWAGGRRGREVIDALLPKVANILSVGGFFYLVCIAENDPDEILAHGRVLGLRAEKTRQEQRGMEELFILRFQKLEISQCS